MLDLGRDAPWLHPNRADCAGLPLGPLSLGISPTPRGSCSPAARQPSLRFQPAGGRSDPLLYPARALATYGAAGGLADDPANLLVPNGAADQIQLANARAVAFGCGTRREDL